MNDIQIAERRERLRVWLAQRRSSSIDKMAQELGVSTMTIRRDLRALERLGLLPQVLGGARTHANTEELPFNLNRRSHTNEKHAIAKEALQVVRSHMSIALSAGTTTWNIAKILRGFDDLTFITNSTNVAMALQENGWEQIILTGGVFRTLSDALVGPLAEKTAADLHSDLLFLGVHGMDLTTGFSTPNVPEASVDRVLMRQTSRLVLVADHFKWGMRALAQIGRMDEVDLLITDDGGGLAEVEALQQQGIAVRVAKVEGPVDRDAGSTEIKGR